MSTSSHLKIIPWGDNAAGVRLLGDPRKPEHAEFNVALPGGEVGIVRASDGACWVHVYTPRPGTPGYSPEADPAGRRWP